MDSLSKKIGNLGIHDIRNAARFAQNMIIQYEPYQVDIRRATNTDSWGPTPKQLAKVMRNRYQVPMYLITEYTMKRLVDHMAKRPKNLYEKARKEYVNYGNEWRVVLKCLLLLEYLLFTSTSGQELDQVLSCINTHKHILTRDTMQFKVEFSNDGKMEIHERGIKKRCEQVVQYIEDTAYLKRARAKHKQQSVQISSSGVGADGSGSYNDNQVRVGNVSGSSYSSYDLDDEFEEYEPRNVARAVDSSSSNHRQRRSSAVDEQRRQRREILRERIKNSEKQRKASIKGNSNTEPVPDLLDLDDTPAVTAVYNNGNADSHHNGHTESDAEDDDFGDFQSEQRPQTGQPSVVNSLSATHPGNFVSDELLQWGGQVSPTAMASSTTSSTAASSSGKGGKDAFADLFTYSKSRI
ncbi:Ent5p Ecym_4264 [Eremothecium cymbalariae DBVPG|uniref:ENTH domain-containing protein n=1 Tax=Eremothecium cymbalariae (strain CBS 270.75 / DBVPG 7215 / KCTC 17166 / NRRL Y-17582) TaxID=931890 RepID=G8JTH5_ERECY|nr:hypothetical protein Ecym_4264 [Eremothecium cymbalariae DBVPG\